MSNLSGSLAKRLLIRLAASTLRGLGAIQKLSPKPLRLLSKPIQLIGAFFLSAAILPGYKIYLSFKKIAKKFYAPHVSQNAIIHPFTRRYLVHAIVVVLAFFTLASNLNANEVRREDFGRTSVLASLITEQDFSSLEEEGPITANVPSRYASVSGVGAQPAGIEGLLNDEQLPSTIAGSSAVVRPILSPVEADLRQRDRIITYAVQPGDTVSQIAEQFGITTNTLLWENNLSSYKIIRPGDVLTILPTSGIRHKVASGNTIASIAKEYKIEPEKIIDFNKLASANDIQTGELLMIPGGAKPLSAPTYEIRRDWYQPPPSAQPVITSSGKMVWPANCLRITQYYNYLHSGADIACSYGSPVYAADDGIVSRSQVGWNGGYGNVIEIEHANGIVSLYGHSSQLLVSSGESVVKGQTIALMGSTGRSTGSHVHFEVRVGGSRANPLNYIR